MFSNCINKSNRVEEKNVMQQGKQRIKEGGQIYTSVELQIELLRSHLSANEYYMPCSTKLPCK